MTDQPTEPGDARALDDVENGDDHVGDPAEPEHDVDVDQLVDPVPDDLAADTDGDG